ncbi:MAG: metallophosphoesterase [Planctomycetia bacterium]|nr:metallophosphoesterase [Planctomycetia bacterium]
MKRRDFLRMTVLTMCSTPVFSASTWADEVTENVTNDVPLDKDLVAIFSDTHILNRPKAQEVVRVKTAIQKILAMNPRPATLLIYGDVAYDAGGVDTYRFVRELLEPIKKAGIHWEATMGNHDRLNDFQQIFPERFTKKSPIPNRYINVVETPKADFILLDSYLKGQVRGEIEPEQRAWLVETLKKYEKKPVFVGCHHPLCETNLEVELRACPGFAAYIHGHCHWWMKSESDNIPQICFPSVGCWGDMGFVMLNLTETEATFIPNLNAYQLPGWYKKSEHLPEDYNDKDIHTTNVEKYLEQLNDAIVTIKLP